MKFSPHCIAFAVTMALTSAAHADDADIDVPGPNGRSSISTWVDYTHSRSDLETIYGEHLARSSASSRSLSLLGNYAITDRVDVNLSVTRSFYRGSNDSAYGRSFFDGNGTSESLGLGLRALGSSTSLGFGLVASAAVHHEEDVDDAYAFNVQPQYRYSPTLMSTVNLGYVTSDDYHSSSFGTSLIWKAATNLTIAPGIDWERTSADDVPSLRTTSAHVMAAYHFDHNLSVSAALGMAVQSDTQYGGLRSVDTHSYSGSVGLRWAF